MRPWRVIPKYEPWAGIANNPTTSTINVGSMAYSGQAIAVNAAHFSAVSVAAMNYVAQTVTTVQVRSVLAVSMNYAAQAITTNAKHFSAVSNAAMSYAGQAIRGAQNHVSTISNSTMAYLGRTIQGGVTIVWRRGLGLKMGERQK